MADIDKDAPSDDPSVPPTPAEERAMRSALHGRIQPMPDANDSGGDQTTPYDGRHATIVDGAGLSPGGNMDMRGDTIAGYSPAAVDITSDLTIDVTNWNVYNGRHLRCNSSSAITITVDDTPAGGTAQSGAASTITLEGTDTALDGEYAWQTVLITSGTGSGQERIIKSYVSSTKVATVETDWTTAPDSSSVYEILPRGDLTFRASRRGTGAVNITPSGNLTAENVQQSTTISISSRYGQASATAWLDLDVLEVAAQ